MRMKSSKLTIVVAVVALLALAAADGWAAWLSNVPVTLQQPDGRTITCYMTGDEYFNWVHDREGYPVIKDPASGFYVYGRRSGGQLTPTSLLVGEADPAAAGLVPGYPVDRAKVAQARLAYQAAPQKQGRIARQAAPTTGAIENLVVFIRFSDDPEFTDPISVYQSSFNNTAAGANSVYNYFREISYQQLSVTSRFYPVPGTTVVSYQDSHPRAYYQSYTQNPLGYQNDTERTNREQALLYAAILAIKNQVPASLKLDGDEDGMVDNVVFIVYGSAGAWNTLLWPHAWALFLYDVEINGNYVFSYSFQIQSYVNDGSTQVLAHEMLHNIGFPDLYHYSYDGFHPLGPWDIMASPIAPPQHPNLYSKYKYGKWIPEPPLADRNGTYTLSPLTAATGNGYKIPEPADPSGAQFYVVEYRRKSSSIFESALPTDGLLVYRIDHRDPDHQGNSSLPDETYIYRPGGTPTANGTITEAAFSAGSGRRRFDRTTNPAPFLADGSAGTLLLYDVTDAAATISFSLAMTPAAEPALSSPPDGTVDAPLALTLHWLESPEALTYHLQLATDVLFGNLVIDQSGIAALEWPVSGLDANTTYFWRVSATTPLGDGAWSTTWHFTTMDIPVYSPQLIAPPNGAEGQSTMPELQWMAVSKADAYEVEVASDESFATLIFSRIGITVTSVTASGLENRSLYYWRVRALNGAGAGPWSEVWTFQTSEVPVELLSFSAAASEDGIELAWATATETENYGFDIERRQAAGSDTAWQKVAFVAGHHSSYSRNNYHYLDPVQEEGIYGYRLKQIDLGGSAAYIASQEVEYSLPRGFTLEQNYPNPFNPETSISYHLPAAGQVTLLIYNIRGQLVRRLVEAEEPAGEHLVKWDGCDGAGTPVAGGSYHYVLRFGRQIERRAMQLLR